MAKKSRRAQRRRGRPASKPMSRPKAPSMPKEVAQAPKSGIVPQEMAIDLSEEYRYVYSDLKKIAILAGAMSIVLIILSFVIR